MAHQCQITQLKDNFKEKYRLNEDWPQKLAFEINKEKDKHNEELKTLENSLKESFKMVFYIFI